MDLGETIDPWAARYNTWLLIKLTPKGVVFSFLFFSETIDVLILRMPLRVIRMPSHQERLPLCMLSGTLREQKKCVLPLTVVHGAILA